MRRARLLLFLLLALPAGADPVKEPEVKEEAAPEEPVVVTGLRIEIVERGLYSAASGETRMLPNGIGENTVLDLALERSTVHIPARPGVSFGFEFVVHGQPRGTPIQLSATVIFPPPGLLPPGQPAPVAFSTTPMVVEVGAPDPVYRGYTFDYEWEVVPGPWRFEIRAGDRVVAVQTFLVTQESTFRH